jgi:hypothetical protein
MQTVVKKLVAGGSTLTVEPGTFETFMPTDLAAGVSTTKRMALIK